MLSNFNSKYSTNYLFAHCDAAIMLLLKVGVRGETKVDSLIIENKISVLFNMMVQFLKLGSMWFFFNDSVKVFFFLNKLQSVFL